MQNANFSLLNFIQVRDSLRLATAEASEFQDSIAEKVQLRIRYPCAWFREQSSTDEKWANTLDVTAYRLKKLTR